MTADLLETLFGDPRDPGNPLGFAAILAADERGEPFTAGAETLAGIAALAGAGTVAGAGAGAWALAGAGTVVGAGHDLEALRSVARRDPRLVTSPESVRVAAATGALDTGLRTTVRHVMSRQLYGRAVVDLPYIRSALAGVFVELLICDAYSTASHVPPAEAEARVASHAVAWRLIAAMGELSVLLGARFYIREGDHAIFQKLLRDVEALGLAVPRPVDSTPVPLDPAEADDSSIRAQLAAIQDLAIPGRSAAARACVDVWRRADDPFLADDAWLLAALTRLGTRPGAPPAAVPEQVEKLLFSELIDRHEALRSFGIADRRFPG